jgi:hypothetical protein
MSANSDHQDPTEFKDVDYFMSDERQGAEAEKE